MKILSARSKLGLKLSPAAPVLKLPKMPELLVLTAAAVAAVGTPVTSARAESGEDLLDVPLEYLEQMVVTAEKRSESLQEVPVAITAFTGDDLNDLGILDTQALQVVTPGLVYSNTGTSAQPYLRGIGTRFAFAGLEPSVATYIDDRYVARAQATLFELTDVERVEILKGPQGTLYGRNAIGGALRIVTRDVEDDFSGSISGTLGNYDLLKVSGAINVPMSEVLGVRISGFTKQRNGYAENLDPRGSPELDDQDVWALRAKLRWELSPLVTGRLTLQHSRQKDSVGNDLVDLSPAGLNVGIARGGISGQDVDEVATAIDQQIDDEQTAADLRFDVSFPALELVSITTWHDFDQTAFSDADGTSEAVLDALLVPQKARAFSQELQLLSANDGPWQWLAGAYFFDERADFEIVLDFGQPELFSQGDQRAHTSAAAVFGQVSRALNDRWSLTIGGRFSYETKRARVRSSTLAANTLAPVPFDDEHSWSELTPRITLERYLSSGMLYATYARGFKSGGYNYAASLNDGQVLNPEVLDMLELGWKSVLRDGRLTLNGSIYYYDYRDLQVTRALAGTGVNVTENAADARALGLDLDLVWMPLDRLTLRAGLNLLDSEYENYDASATIFSFVDSGDPTMPGMTSILFDASGESLLRAPDQSWFLSAELELGTGPVRLPVLVSYAYKDDFYYDFVAHPSSDRLRQRAYGLLSARISLEPASERWGLSLWGNNLTNEDDYYMDIVANSAGIRGSHGAPRTWGLDVTFRF